MSIIEAFQCGPKNMEENLEGHFHLACLMLCSSDGLEPKNTDGVKCDNLIRSHETYCHLTPLMTSAKVG